MPLKISENTMKTKKPSKLSKLAIALLLWMHGWKPCKLSDGSKGWTKRESPTCTRTGPLEYAIAHLLA